MMRFAQLKLISILLFLSLNLLIFRSLRAQEVKAPPTSSQIGLPGIQNFLPSEYKGHPQVDGITQDSKGLLYFATGNGILQYDGVNWKKIALPKTAWILSIACAKNDVVFAGAQGELGYLIPAEPNILKFQSLLEKVPEQYQDFTYVQDIVTTDSFVYFLSDKYLFRWPLDGKATQLKAWPLKNIYHSFHVVEDELYLWQWDVGLEKMEGDSLQVLPNTELFRNTTIKLLARLDDQGDKLFVATVQRGFAIYDGLKVEGTGGSDLLFKLVYEGSLSKGLRLENGNYVFSTRTKGIILTDSSFRIIQVLDENTGLVSNQVVNLFVDQAGALWVGTFNGVSRIEFPSPFSFYDKNLGLTGNVQGIFHHKDRMYIYGYTGFYQLSKPEPFDCRTRIESKDILLHTSITDVLEVDGLYIAGSDSGIITFDPEDDSTEDSNQMLSYVGTNKLIRSRFRSDLFYALMGQSIGLFQKDADNWKFIGQINGLPGVVNSMAETTPGQLWAVIASTGEVLRIDIEEGAIPRQVEPLKGDPEYNIPAQLKIFNQVELQTRKCFSVDFFNGNPIFATSKGLGRFDPKSERIVPERSLPYTDTSQAIIFLQTKANGNTWIVSGDGEQSSLVQLQASEKKEYTMRVSPFQQIYAQEITITNIDEDPNDSTIAWLSTSSGLIKYNSSIKKNFRQSFPILVREVLVNTDSLIYGGEIASMKAPQLSYELNSMRFEYAAPVYELPTENRYQVFLEGFDKDWSKWTSETRKDYTNLREGKYTFRVRGRDVFGNLGEAGNYSFTISPPWYRTWWAYFIYTVAALSLLILIVNSYNTWRNRRLLAQNVALEKLVGEQTKELRKNNERLTELDQLKSQFFTDISHEFRTPLSVILGMVDQIEKKPKTWLEKGTAMIRQNTNYLLRLVNQILELRHLEVDTLPVNMVNDNIISYLQYIASPFKEYAENKGIFFRFNPNPSELNMDFDPDKILRIVSNLLSNAIKFTKEGGTISMNSEVQNGHLKIEVIDTGIGIVAEKLPYVFDRYYQIKNPKDPNPQGSGIGLALCKALVELIGGTIKVSSKIGEGSTFSFQLPITQNATVKGEIPGKDSNSVLLAAGLTGASKDIGVNVILNEEKPSLLIVEDNPDMAQLLIAGLEDQFNLQVAKDGEEGISAAIQEIPDLIISDVMMPIKDGYELTDTLKKDKRTDHIPIILLTAKGDSNSKLSGLERGADAYLTKPFDNRELLVRINNLLALRDKIQERYSLFYADTDSKVILEDPFLNDLHEYVGEHLSDASLNMEQISRATGMSRTQVYRKLKALTGQSATLFIRSIRLNKGKELLQTTNLSISEIAYEVGFTSPNYFSTSFMKEFGVRPSAIRKNE